MAKIQKITPFLWFDQQAEEAAHFYISIFKNAKILKTIRHANGVSVVRFSLDGQEFTALNGGPGRHFTEAISFVIHCKGQKEVDYYWEKLTADGGEESMCAWLKDKYGVSWQVVPDALTKLLGDPDPAVSQRAIANMMQMRKIVIRQLTKEPKKVNITVRATISVPIETVWDCWNTAADIMKWNHAGDDWHCPAASLDLRPGGKFSYTMAAKDGSFSFDFEGVYDEVQIHQRIAYTIADGRKVKVLFKAKGKKTEVIETFEAENMHSHDMQRAGWQAILDNFKRLAEAK
ncbi:MAG: VOC family protein [Saprospiraceae bacterium]|nr:VOC family protein [Saprospiraceae bacterium]